MMIILGETLFWRFLEDIDVAFLDHYLETLTSLLSEATNTRFQLQSVDPSVRERLVRWSKGLFNASGELATQFPRITFVLGGVSDARERWIADVFFTRVPHIRGIYSNRASDHSLSGSLETNISRQIVESHLADVFTRKQAQMRLGTAGGLYVHQKMMSLRSLRNIAEDSKYSPPGSDLKGLLQKLASILRSEARTVPEITELSTNRKPVRDFLARIDALVVSKLGVHGLELLLEPVEVSAKHWVDAGK